MSDTPQAPVQLDQGWLRRVDACEQFEDRWQKSGAAPIAEFLNLVDSSERGQLLRELIKIDIEHRWGRGERRRVEEYAADFPELGNAATLPIDLIVEEMHVRQFHGSPPTEAELSTRFPGRLAELFKMAALTARSVRTASDKSSNPPNPSADATQPDGGPAQVHSGTNLITIDSKEKDDPHGTSRSGLQDTRSFTGPDRDLAATPRQIGRYELRAKIGRGGFATVYRAWDPDLRREVAVKLRRFDVESSAERDERMHREAQSAARLRHPAIVPTHEVGEHDGSPFIVCELLPGPSLSELIARTQPAPQQAAAWVARLADALEYAHQCGIVHRDVKPSNILMDRDGQPALADFGLAFDAEALSTLTQQGDILGTPAYMSPEQAAGRGHTADGRTDVYGLGVVLYELLAGQVPFTGNPASVLHRVLNEEPRPPREIRAHVPLDLETICLKAMAKEPARRYETAGAMAEDLRAYLEHRPIAARRLSPIGHLARWCRRNPALASTIAVAVLALSIVGGVSYARVVRERNRYLEERETAIAERKNAVSNLYDSLMREARAIRLARRTGYRAAAWGRLKQAMQLNTPANDPESLRQEAAACLGDFVGNEPAVWTDFPQGNPWSAALAFDPSSKILAVAFRDGVIQLREPATGRTVGELLGHQAGVFALSFSGDGRTLASLDDLGVTRIWRSEGPQSDSGGAWRLFRQIPGIVGAERDNIVAVSCSITRDGKHVLPCVKGEQRVRFIDVETGTIEFEFRGAANEAFVRTVLSPDGKTLVGAYRSVENDGVVVWNVADQRLITTFPVTSQAIVDVAFSGDGAFLACACLDGTYVYETAGWGQRTIVRSDDQFFTVAFHPHRPIVAVPTTRTSSIRLWDVVGNHEIALLEHPGRPHSVAFSPDGSFMASASNGSFRMWNLRSGGEKTVIAAHRGPVNCVQFSPNGRLLASAGGDARVRLWDAPSGRQWSEFSISPTPTGKVQSVAFSPDGRRLAAVDWDGAAAVYDVTNPSSPQRLATLLNHEQKMLGHILWSVEFSPDGQYVAIAGQGGVWVWQGDQRVAAPTDRSSFTAYFSPDSKVIVWRQVGAGQVGAWNLKSSEPIPIPKSLERSGWTFFRNASQTLLLSGRSEQDKAPILQVADLGTGQTTRLEWAHVPDTIREVEFGDLMTLSPDQSLLALTGDRVTVWDLAARRLLVALPSEASPASFVAWHPDCSQIAIALTDGTIVIWHLQTLRRQLAELGLGW